MSKGFLSSLPSFPENSHQAAVLSIASYQESGSVPDNMLFADFSNRNSGSQGVTSDLRSARCCSSQYIEEQSRTDSANNRQYLPYINQSNFDVEQSILERDCSAKSSTLSNSSCKYSIAVDENEPDCARKTEPMETDRYPDKTLEKNPLLTDSAQAVLNMGYLPKHVKQAVDNVLKTKTWQTMNVEDILDVITENDEENSESAKTQNEASAADDIKNPEKLKESNETLRERTICKMCCTERVSIVFLPCGHLVSCGQCSPALRKCPMCRQGIKGTVRVKFN
uniref:RING-type domain-containing protein n=1 Tax=Magallana gigas TaxID=29159 RepID=A0A8W8JDM4_MAGGI